ncbi:MAG: SulP family inorganic anion transporter [Acidimicrobiia bacterium]
MTSRPPTPRSGGAARLAPGLDRLRHYERSWLRVDLLAGLTVGAMLVPQGMAYAELADMPPVTGFYAALLALVAYAFVGSSRHLGVGPEPGTAILAATGVGAIAAGDPARYLALMAALALIVGSICLLAAFARLGFIANVLSKPVLVGYITGVGLTLLSSQYAKFTGIAIESDAFFGRTRDLLAGLDGIDGLTIAVGSTTLILIVVLRWRIPTIPGALLGVVLATSFAALLGLDADGLRLVGEVPQGLPSFGLPDVGMGDIVDLLPVAAGIALVGYSDNVLTGRAIGARMGYRIDPNQELAALGVANLGAGLSQGFPISSSASRTAVPASLGSKTQLVGIVAAIVVLATLLFLSPVLAEIPEAALAAVIIAAAVAIIDVSGFRSLWSVSRTEFGLAVTAGLAVMVFDVLVGALVAVGLSVLVALGRIATPHDAILGAGQDLDGWVDAEAHPTARTLPGLLVYRFDAPLFFANATRYRERLELLVEENPGEEEWLVLDFEGVGEADTTAIDMLVELLDEHGQAGRVVAIARANDRVLHRLQRAGIVEPIGPALVFPTINSAVRAFQRRGTD